MAVRLMLAICPVLFFCAAASARPGSASTSKSLLSTTPKPTLTAENGTFACSIKEGCRGANNTNTLYICGDARLGPVQLPTVLPLGSFVDTYDQFGDQCPGAFLRKWFNFTSNSYVYPPHDGFQLDVAGKPILGHQTLRPGARLDRFGSEYGTFLSPAGAPYNQRALPPSNLDTPPNEPSYPYNYHVYEVVKPFDVVAGPIAEWFDQPGQGVQYQAKSNIMTLIQKGFLRRIMSSPTSHRRMYHFTPY